MVEYFFLFREDNDEVKAAILKSIKTVNKRAVSNAQRLVVFHLANQKVSDKMISTLSEAFSQDLTSQGYFSK